MDNKSKGVYRVSGDDDFYKFQMARDALANGYDVVVEGLSGFYATQVVEEGLRRGRQVTIESPRRRIPVYRDDDEEPPAFARTVLFFIGLVAVGILFSRRDR